MGASIRKFLSFPLMLLKFNHKCLSVATRAAIDRPIDLAVFFILLHFQCGKCFRAVCSHCKLTYIIFNFLFFLFA